MIEIALFGTLVAFGYYLRSKTNEETKVHNNSDVIINIED